MSHRTIIEINHDYWHDLESDPQAMQRILHLIENSRGDAGERHLRVHGVRILGRRHHSETLKLKVE